MTPADLAHMAGLIDAIGRVRIHETAEGTQLAHVGISSPDLALLRHCARLTGVRVTIVRRDFDRLGCVEHCDERHQHVASITGRWQLVGARAVIVLRAVRPYLVVRDRDVDAVLELAGDAPSKPATARKMHALGWVA